MKHLLLTLPLAALLAGCSSNSDNQTAQAPAPPAAPLATSAGNAMDASAPDTSAPSGTSATHDYKVVDETAGLPPAAANALKKVKVPPPPKSMKVPAKATVVLQTSKGPITVELNGTAAPLHVKSFLYLAQRGFFNGTQFHRYEPGFVIQGGDPLSKNEATRQYAGVGGPGYEIPREKNALAHEAMVIAAARSQDPDSAGSQFYFTLKPAPFLDQGEGYTVFGKVVSGEATVLKLRKGDTLKSVTVLPASTAKK
jgi:cyclophilin family peptidyl-prolyl cis-trans isomerase